MRVDTQAVLKEVHWGLQEVLEDGRMISGAPDTQSTPQRDASDVELEMSI